MTTEEHGYTKSSEEYLAERREKVRQERQKLYCEDPIRPETGVIQLLTSEFKRCDYESFSK